MKTINMHYFLKQIRSTAIVCPLVLLVVITGCQSHIRDIQPKSETTPDLQNITLRMEDLSGNSAKLINGGFRGNHLSVDVLRTATADLNQDGFIDGAVIALQNSGGSGNFRVLCLLLNDGKKMVNTDEVYLGDRIKIANLNIDRNTITVNYLDRGLEDSYSVDPYIKKQVQYRVLGVKLEKLPTDKDKSTADQTS